MTHLTSKLNRCDFTHLRFQLSLPMTSNEYLQDFIGTHQLLHDQFAEAHQPLSELDKCHHFREAVKTLPHIYHAIDSNLVAHQLVGKQNYQDLTTHTLDQAPNFTPTAAAMGYAANTTGTISSLEADDVSPVLRSPAFAALITAAVKAATPTNPRNARARNPTTKRTPPAIPSSDRVDCFHHGYDKTMAITAQKIIPQRLFRCTTRRHSPHCSLRCVHCSSVTFRDGTTAFMFYSRTV